MVIEKRNFYAILYALIVGVFSFYLMPFYQHGDQDHYREVYKYCFYENYTHLQQFFCYSNTIGSAEPVYFYLTKFAHLFIENKDIYITILNTAFAYVLTLVVLKFYKVSWHRHIFLFLVFTNFYLIVLLFSAERLKISILFLLSALLLKHYRQLLLLGVALLAHMQSFLLIFPIIAHRILAGELSKLKKLIFLAGSVIAFGGIFIFLQNHFLAKLAAYTSNDEDGGFGAIIKTGIYVIFALISTRKILPALTIMPVVLLSYFIGESRVGMIAFMIYAASVIYYKKQMDLVLLALLVYFSIKSISFVDNFIQYGNGF